MKPSQEQFLRRFYSLFLDRCCFIIHSISSFFFLAKKKWSKEKRHFWQIAPQPKEALLRVLAARVILFVCAGATAPHAMAPLFVFFLGLGIFTASVSLFSLFLRTVSFALLNWHLTILLSFNPASDNFQRVYFCLFLRPASPHCYTGILLSFYPIILLQKVFFALFLHTVTPASYYPSIL